MKFTGSGIAAVVGPNGCGKSNLSDAISWVLGEQSAKSLRGARMEDVIFAGTRDKKALGMASVTMTLVPDERVLAAATAALPSLGNVASRSDAGEEPALPLTEGDSAPQAIAYTNSHVEQAPVNGAVATPVKNEALKTAERTGEITITRRLYRSGESEYLINGKLARLRDIQDLFFGTGLGPESYAIIEQGRIGQILSNRPQDRRAVVEEAAGITKFKTRKRLAEAKLESAKQNLSRVFDILEEVTRQVNSLKRQAAKTKRYGELRDEATGYLRRILAAKFSLLERESAKVAIDLSLASAELETAQMAISTREGEQSTVLGASYETEQQLTTARKLLADLHVEAERVRGRLEYQLKQIGQIDHRLQSGEQEAQVLEQQQQERAAEFEEQTVQWQSLEGECTGARQQLEAKSAEREQAQSKLSEQERHLEAARQSVLRMLGESSALKNRITQMEGQLISAERDRERSKTDEQQSMSDLTRIEQTKAQLSERLTTRQTELISVTDQRKSVEQELQQKRTALHENRQALDKLRSEFSRVKARKDSLQEVLQHRSYTTETVKRLFTAVEGGKAHDLRPVGVLADFLEVDAQLEKAAEEFLHDELEYVVVRDWADAERGIELMRGDLNGRATFLVEGSTEGADEIHELPELASEPGIMMKLTDGLRLTNGLSSLPLKTLPRVSNCYVISDRTQGQELAAKFPHCWFLTADGVNYHGQAVSGGKKSGAGPLALKRELRDISRLAEGKQREVTAAQEQLAELEHTIAHLSEHLEHLRSKQQAQEKDVLALDHENRKMAEEFQRVHTRLSRARLELDRVSKDRIGIDEKLEVDRTELTQKEEGRAEQERSLEAAREALTGLQAELARAAEEHAALRANLASLEERRRSLAANRARLEGQVQEFGRRREHLSREMHRLIEERAHLLQSNSELDAKTSELGASVTSTDASVNTLAEQEAEARNRLAALEEELKRLRTDAQFRQEARSELQVALARAESDIRHLEETCQKELAIALTQLLESVETVEDPEALQDLDGKYAEVRRKIEALGPVNPQALEEFEEAQHRQDFLSAQRQDLLDSIRDTEKAIHEIDNESRKRFGEAFHAINQNFREMFKVLFGGGIGEMRLTDEENLGESGIEIVASPPGKKLQSVLLLSGGEKSLTAMALLMGIFQYTPSPFCILDEVDAPLDEPNIQRLTKLLEQMAENTQFIVITHAKRTMEAAQALYGVTMQEPGVSKLVSVKFKENGVARRVTQEVVESHEEQFEAAMA